MRRLPDLILAILGLILTCQGYVWAGTVEVREEGSLVDYPYSLNFIGCGTVTVTDSIADVDLSACGGSSGNSFETIDVPAGTDPVADSATDTLTITETSFLTITGTAASDSIAITQVTTDLGTDGLIAANAVALTTDTTGNYVGTIGDCTASEGAACFNGSNGSQLIFEGPVGANQIFEFDTGSADFEMENDLTLQDTATVFRLTDTSAGEDDFTLNVDANAFTLSNVIDSVTYLTFASTHAITLGHASVPSVTITTDGTGTAELVVPNDSITLSTETAGNYVLDVNDGTGIDGTAAGEGATYTPTLDLTEISSATLGAGSFTTLTFDAGATDPVLTASSGFLDLTAGTLRQGGVEVCLEDGTNCPASGAGDITAVGNIASGAAFTSGTPGAELYFADNGFLGLGTSKGRIEFDDQTIDEINFLTDTASAPLIGIGTATPSKNIDVVAAATDTAIENLGVGITLTPTFTTSPIDTEYARGLSVTISGTGAGGNFASIGAEILTQYNGNGTLGDQYGLEAISQVNDAESTVTQSHGAYIESSPGTAGILGSSVGLEIYAAEGTSGATDNLDGLNIFVDADMGATTDVMTGIYLDMEGTAATRAYAIYIPATYPSYFQGDIELGATGVVLSSDNDGAFKITGNSAGSDENILLNLDDVSNVMGVSSTTSVTNINFASIGLTTGAANDFSAATTTLGVLAGTIDAGGATSLETVNGTGPTVDAAGEFAVDTTDDQWVYYGAAKRVLAYERTGTFTIESLAATDDNYAFAMFGDAVTITGVACNCRGTCSTLATFTLEDRGGNAMTITGTNPTCATTGSATYAAVTSGNQLTAGEAVAFDVTNSPTTGDTYLLSLIYTIDAQ